MEAIVTAAALLEHHLAVPDEATAEQAAQAVEELERFLRQHPDGAAAEVSLTAADDGTTLEIPGHALRAARRHLGRDRQRQRCHRRAGPRRIDHTAGRPTF